MQNNRHFNELYLKILLFPLLILNIYRYRFVHLKQKYNITINDIYHSIQSFLNISFHNNLNKKIKIGIYCKNLKNGGIQRSTSLTLKYLNKIEIFKSYLFAYESQEDDEYNIPGRIRRITIKNKSITNLIKEIRKNRIDILIYQFPLNNEINLLNKINNIKTIFVIHSSFFYWLYSNYTYLSIYESYKNSKYIISSIPLENDYLFKKWGINSTFISNFIYNDYNKIIPSDLSSKIILMIGRGNKRLKRFDLGIISMEYISKEIKDSEMKIISNITDIDNLKYLVENLNITNYVKFVGYKKNPEVYFKKSSLHLFPSISESFGYVLSETKIYSIPNILMGLDYVSIAKEGTIIIYDDTPESLAKEGIKILKNENYRKKLGKQARKSMKKINNDFPFRKWIELILSVYNGYEYYDLLRKKEIEMNKLSALNILNNQIKLLKMRNSNFSNFTINNIENFSF
jgi:glycosyltransferase involved in cell wall biosynthesis